ncbi:MAG: NFACT RNA binding domain-containing protein, partial [Candidatus Sericytochromatia bacterium]
LIENFSYISGSTAEFITGKNALLKGLEINENIKLETYSNLKNFYEKLYSDKIYLEKFDSKLEINYGDKIPEISKEVENHFFNLETNKNFNNNKNSLIKITTKFLNKAKEKIEHINKFLNDNEEELLKQYGDLIYSNLYNLPEKAEFIEVENYYKDNEIIRIDLNSEKTLSENAQYFLKRYAKLKGTREANNRMLASLEFEDSFLEDVLFNIDNAISVEDLKEIEQELQEENYITSKNKEKSKKKKELRKSDLLSFNYNDVDILVGKNNTQNEFLTMKYASPQDIWLHARLIPGSHVVIRTENGNKKVSDELISYAAKLAAKYSKAKYSSNVCVVYTKIKNIKKPSGSKAGYVTYSNEKAVYVTPDF